MTTPSSMTRQSAESLAVAALSFLAERPDVLGRFLAVTGIGPGEIRRAAAEPEFLGGVLDHIMGDEALLIEFSQFAEIKPAVVGRARTILSGRPFERDTP